MVTCVDYLTEGQDPKAVEKLMGNVTPLLAAGEEIEYVAVQQKPLFNAFPDCVAVTQLRIIFCRLRNFGLNMEFQAHLWEDVLSVQFVENIASTNITVSTAKVTEIMGYLPLAQARRLHDFARIKEAEQVNHRPDKNRDNVVRVTSYGHSMAEPGGRNSDKPLKTHQQRKAPSTRPLHQGRYDQLGNAAYPAY